MSKQSEITDFLQTTDLLADSVNNAEMLLGHAATHGLDIDKDIVEAVIRAKKNQEANKWDTDSEIKFWMAFRALSKTTLPVTVDSLISTHRRKIHRPNFLQKFFNRKTKQPYSRKAVRTYLVFAFVIMLLMLATQMFSLKGTTLLNTIQRNHNDIHLIDKDVDKLKLLLSADKNNRAAKLEKERLYTKKEELDQEIRSSIDLLEPWVFVLRKFTLLGNKKSPEEKTKVKISDAEEIGPNGPPGTNVAKLDVDNQISIIQEAQNFTQIIQLYILPLLYGLIGGFVFVLRGLAADFKNMVYSSYSNIKYSLRIHLGALAGLIVGLLWGDIESQRISFIDSLSTAALAFIAGYGVEYLFNGLDKFANSISSSKDKKD